MLFVMNALIGAVLFGGLAIAKSLWSGKKRLKAVGVAIIAIVVSLVLMFMKNNMKIG